MRQSAEAEVATAPAGGPSGSQCEASPDAAFYAAYEWCLNPVLTVGELRLRLRQTWQLLRSAGVDWQRQECRVNLYLLLCGLSCAVADYLGHRPWRLAGVVGRLARLGPAIRCLRGIVNAPYLVRTRRDRQSIRRWASAVDSVVDAVCSALADEAADGGDWSFADSVLAEVLDTPLPPAPLRWKMTIPEAFRCQDLTQYDVTAMARLYATAFPRDTRPVLVVGARTAGAYFAPLVHTCLEQSGFASRGWMTMRPNDGVSGQERRRLRQACARGERLLLVDDHPNTGHTFAALIELLRGLGASAGDMVIIAPGHPAQSDWVWRVKPVRVLSLQPSEFHKARLLRDDRWLMQAVRGCFSAECAVRLQPSAQAKRINMELESHYADSFQVRLKRVFEVEVSGASAAPARKLVLAKSVGWGWLGYHALIAAQRLAGFVPPVLGFCGGFLFTEWLGDGDWPAIAPSAAGIATAVPLYIAARARRLSLQTDPSASPAGTRRTGQSRLLQVLRRPYGRTLGWLARAVLDRRHALPAPPSAVLVDGRMSCDNWVSSAAGACKVDFEQHNFGGGEQDIVDPAYDLASAIYHLRLDGEQERRLIDEYAAKSGDDGVQQRILPYKLYVGLLEMERAAYELERFASASRPSANLRFLAARNFLVGQFNRHHAGRIPLPPPARWTDRLFFLDLDGVFDVQALGYFPHTTPSGLRALHALATHGYSVVPNTGRSVEHVRDYCRSFGLPGGIAEHGCIFHDHIAGREHRLYEDEAAGQLARCRELVEKLPGVYLDPGYESAVRAYRYRGGVWAGLHAGVASELLRSHHLDALDVIETSSDAYFIPRGAHKGAALAAVKERLGRRIEFVAAIGDSAADLEMLRRADMAFIPGNGERQLRTWARSHPHIVHFGQPCQRGLLQAVEMLLRHTDDIDIHVRPGSPRDPVRPADSPVDLALSALDLPPVRRWAAVVRDALAAGADRHHLW